MVLIDYRKAFDIVDHDLLIKKSQTYGTVNQELKWCHSHLLHSKQCLGQKVSSEVFLKYGVPQAAF